MQSDHSGDADVVVDVRKIPGEPFDEIMTSLSDLSESETLLLTAPFEPEPLYEVLQERGYAFEATNPENGRWEVYIEQT